MTSLVRWNRHPSTGRLALRGDIDALFESLLPHSESTPAAFAPSVDIEESRDEFVLRVDLPGIEAKDVKVTLLGDVLTIRGERKQQSEQKNGSVHRVERRYGSFERSFRLGVPVRTDQVKASSRDGVLEIHVPKADEARTREIEVQVAS